MKILIAVDEAQHAHEIALVASRLFPTAQHLLLSAVDISSYLITGPLFGGVTPLTATVEALAAEEDRAEQAVENAAEVLEPTTTTTTVLGDPGPAICAEAQKHGADVVVVGRRSRSWLSRLFDPSTSEYVVRHAHCPVLVVSEQDPRATRDTTEWNEGAIAAAR